MRGKATVPGHTANDRGGEFAIEINRDPARDCMIGFARRHEAPFAHGVERWLIEALITAGLFYFHFLRATATIDEHMHQHFSGVAEAARKGRVRRSGVAQIIGGGSAGDKERSVNTTAWKSPATPCCGCGTAQLC